MVTVSRKTGSNSMWHLPLINCPSPKSSNQFSGLSWQYMSVGPFDVFTTQLLVPDAAKLPEE
jgi:hypothetical protein